MSGSITGGRGVARLVLAACIAAGAAACSTGSALPGPTALDPSGPAAQRLEGDPYQAGTRDPAAAGSRAARGVTTTPKASPNQVVHGGLTGTHAGGAGPQE